jgi:hypothetical protein
VSDISVNLQLQVIIKNKFLTIAIGAFLALQIAQAEDEPRRVREANADREVRPPPREELRRSQQLNAELRDCMQLLEQRLKRLEAR